MNLKVMYSNKSDEWETPIDLFNSLNNEFMFTLDPCATAENHKCSKWFSAKDNGLEKSWGGHTVFCNPPYSQIKLWAKKAWEEHFNPDTTIVMLIPARTDTQYFHNYIYHRAEIRFIKGRLKFGDGKNPAPFPSMIVIWRSAENTRPTIEKGEEEWDRINQ